MRGHAYLQAGSADQACKVLTPAIAHQSNAPQKRRCRLQQREGAFNLSLREGKDLQASLSPEP
jgi:hypothetical protein